MATKKELIEQIHEIAPWADTDGLLHSQLLDLLAGIKDGTVTQPVSTESVADEPVDDAPIDTTPESEPEPVEPDPIPQSAEDPAPVETVDDEPAPVADAPVADRLTGTIRNTMRNPQMVGSKLLPAGATRLIEPREIMGEKNVRRFLSAIKLGMLEWID